MSVQSIYDLLKGEFLVNRLKEQTTRFVNIYPHCSLLLTIMSKMLELDPSERYNFVELHSALPEWTEVVLFAEQHPEYMTPCVDNASQLRSQRFSNTASQRRIAHNIHPDQANDNRFKAYSQRESRAHPHVFNNDRSSNNLDGHLTASIKHNREQTLNVKNELPNRREHPQTQMLSPRRETTRKAEGSYQDNNFTAFNMPANEMVPNPRNVPANYQANPLAFDNTTAQMYLPRGNNSESDQLTYHNANGYNDHFLPEEHRHYSDMLNTRGDANMHNETIQKQSTEPHKYNNVITEQNVGFFDASDAQNDYAAPNDEQTHTEVKVIKDRSTGSTNDVLQKHNVPQYLTGQSGIKYKSVTEEKEEVNEAGERVIRVYVKYVPVEPDSDSRISAKRNDGPMVKPDADAIDTKGNSYPPKMFQSSEDFVLNNDSAYTANLNNELLNSNDQQQPLDDCTNTGERGLGYGQQIQYNEELDYNPYYMMKMQESETQFAKSSPNDDRTYQSRATDGQVQQHIYQQLHSNTEALYRNFEEANDQDPCYYEFPPVPKANTVLRDSHGNQNFRRFLHNYKQNEDLLRSYQNPGNA